MFGSEVRIRRPILLVVVYGAFIALVGITATAQAAMVSSHYSTSTLNALVGSDSATVRSFVNAYVSADHLRPGLVTDAELDVLEGQLRTLLRPGEIAHVELRLPDGTIVASEDAAIRGTRGPSTADYDAAAAGDARAGIVPLAEAGAGGTALAGLTTPTVLREYFPISSDGRVQAVMAIWRDAAPILAGLDETRRDVVLVILSASAVAAVLLFLVFRAAQGRISRQTAALVESTRRDALTGVLNHGALVGHLAVAIEKARADEEPLGVALLDVDGFRLLNDNHGHRAGDETLLVVAELLEERLPAGMLVGRYGPDEFLMIAPAADVADLEPLVERLREALVHLSLQFDGGERLPITISAGICTYPEHGSSVTALLSTAAQTLEEAKASGGDAIRVAGDAAEEAPATGFDVLQGLIFAVDTKDRYTKRHSEDVSRYGVFLAQRLGLEPDFVETVRVAGLLHDVGKIGIPDPILRKPGRLTEEEYAIVKQHVALGDMIVRDVPEIDTVRAGIRHHHERWDGAGYLHGLARDEIPLIARILAVGDAFSAMTTTRRYRKALDIREALLRLEDAAGSQLDERLVLAFIQGIETAPDAPLPGMDVPAATLWTPTIRRVA